MNVLYMINYAGKAGTEKYVENLIIIGKGRINPFFAYNIEGELSQKMRDNAIPSLQIEMSWRSTLSAAKKLAAYCRKNAIDVIHAQYPRENIIALLSKHFYNSPKVVLTNHLTLRLSGVSGFIWRLLNRHFTPQNHRIIAVCNEGREIMIKNGVMPKRIVVIYNGVAPMGKPEKSRVIRQELGLTDDCFVMTIFARFSPEKGLLFLLESLVALKKKTDEPFYCLICGDGDQFGDISAKVSALGLERTCKLLGFRKDTHSILLGSDIYLCCSSCNEAMSFAILEAMNAGLPLVVTDVGGNRDLAETGIRCGFVCNYGDSDCFSESIKHLMADIKLKEALSLAAIKKIETDFDLNKLANDVFAAYN